MAAILAAGARRSPEFLGYVDQAKWEGGADLSAHLGESSDEAAAAAKAVEEAQQEADNKKTPA